MQTIRLFLLMMVCALLASCSGLPGGSRSSRFPDSPGAPGAPGRTTQPDAGTTRPPVVKPGDKSAPIPDRIISLSGRCVQSEEDGFREEATLVVRSNEVQNVAWQLWVGKRGSCSFKQADFKQTQFRPHIELTAVDGSGCKLIVWQDPRRVTLAHNGCQKRCSPGVYEEAWPVMFDPANGACAKTD